MRHDVPLRDRPAELPFPGGEAPPRGNRYRHPPPARRFGFVLLLYPIGLNQFRDHPFQLFRRPQLPFDLTLGELLVFPYPGERVPAVGRERGKLFIFRPFFRKKALFLAELDGKLRLCVLDLILLFRDRLRVPAALVRETLEILIPDVDLVDGIRREDSGRHCG